MVVSLAKGQKVDLTKTNPGLTTIQVGLGWDINRYDGGQEFDLDAAAFLLDTNSKLTTDSDFIYYNNKANQNNSVVSSGDSLNGAGTGDDETILVDLTNVPDHIDSIALTVTIHEADVRNQNFGMVENSYIRIMNQQTGEELIRYDLGEDFSVETAIIVAKLYRHNGEWKFNAVGAGFQGGLEALCQNFGLNLQ
ncbi:TerD family protein [Viridibacillus arvi]|uniref:TerD family protein n=1 Tax=Viridibacillus arvi TaxID=263475 RepID=UPI0034CFD782